MAYFRARKSRWWWKLLRSKSSKPPSLKPATSRHPSSKPPLSKRRPAVIELPSARFPLLHQFYQRIGWRGKFGIVAGLVFSSMILLPAALAAVTHRPGIDVSDAWIASGDAGVSVRLYEMQTAQVNTVALNDYLVGVLAAEMDPNAPMDALKAAAVAARTYAVQALSTHSGGTPSFADQHGADVTDNANLDLPWLSIAEQEQKFQSALGVDTVRLQQAILATDNLILTYDGQPILAFTFTASPGVTRDGSKVFGKPLPYLKSVKCDNDAKAPVRAPVSKSAHQVAEALQLKGNVSLSDLKIATRDEYGFVQAVTFKDMSWTGQDFAALLGLPSANFTWNVAGGQLVVLCKGIGSDIGMSLNEAKALAAQGESWRDIVSYFYPGAQVGGDDKFTQVDGVNA